MANKTKKNYEDLFKEMITYYTDPVNRSKFDFKRYYLELGFRPNNIRQMIMKYKDLNDLWYDIKEIIIDTISRMILNNEINKDAFAIRYMKLLFQNDLRMHTPEEIAAIEKLRSERKLDEANTDQVIVTISKATMKS